MLELPLPLLAPLFQSGLGGQLEEVALRVSAGVSLSGLLGLIAPLERLQIARVVELVFDFELSRGGAGFEVLTVVQRESTFSVDRLITPLLRLPRGAVTRLGVVYRSARLSRRDRYAIEEAAKRVGVKAVEFRRAE
jgi:hypothetical protein